MRGRHSKQLDDPRLSQQSMAPSLSRPTHMRGKLPHHVLSHILEEVERDPSLASLSRATHMSRTARICVEGKLISNSFKATLQ
ncbi:hypothetical protein PIB30_102654, partial [Stylosanthes scabra]|nr:hypothetical protein [Stylosanthes scabra]